MKMRLKREKHLVMLLSLSGVTLCYTETEFTQRDDWSIPYSHYKFIITRIKTYKSIHIYLFTLHIVSHFIGMKKRFHNTLYSTLGRPKKLNNKKIHLLCSKHNMQRKNSETLYIGLLYRHIGVYFCSLLAWSFQSFGGIPLNVFSCQSLFLDHK